MFTVHPHIRGAYSSGFSNVSDSVGSSPHTWGIRPRPRPTLSPPAVHPHIRGAYRECDLPSGVLYGSSPHTWGIRHKLVAIVPDKAVHPHIRGAYSFCTPAAHRSAGSSPHTWGIRYDLLLLFGCFPVHPHIRGAYFPGFAMIMSESGSSPHTWGIRSPRTPGRGKSRFIPTYVGHTLCWVIRRQAENRFIPTYVGHTVSRAAQGVSPAVHPHIRGAYRCSFSSRSSEVGSSPHTWGIRVQGFHALPVARFIPTYVGHTDIDACKGAVMPVHPHIRGAY